MSLIRTSTIGFPRIGGKRQMKLALEKYWKGQQTETGLMSTQREVEAEAWGSQHDAGITSVGLDSTLYDHVLDTIAWVGAVPRRFQHLSGLEQYFAMARGAEGSTALDMSKFFDSNYHFLVPELEAGFSLRPNLEHVLAKVRRGQALLGAAAAVPIILGPVTFISLARCAMSRDAALETILPAYEALLGELRALGVPQVQLHEPVLVTSAASSLQASFETSYRRLAKAAGSETVQLQGSVPGDMRLTTALCLVTYYDDLEEDVYRWAVQLPVAALHLDFLGVPGASFPNRNLEWIEKHGWPAGLDLGAGVVDGRSVWADRSDAAAALLRHLAEAGVPPGRLVCASSAPLQHLPFSLEGEPALSMDEGLRGRLAFATEKLGEIVAAASEVSAELLLTMLKTTDGPGGGLSVGPGSAPSLPPQEAVHHRDGQGELSLERPEPYPLRRPKQVQLPPFPTTSIGSFPQTQAVRSARAAFRAGRLTEPEYQRAMAAHIGMAVGVQEALGLDVLVHGEAERTDMVEFFGQELEGFHFTHNGWVQSYGSRYVRPPIIAADVRFVKPMTVAEFKLAQSLTAKPMKGMLTGPVTVLNWSFPRKDISRKAQAFQLAAALRQEVAALEAAGCKVVQVDEPALREGLPLKTSRHAAYLRWAVDAFRCTTAVAAPETQIVTHLCYSDFEDIMQAIEEMDADVLTIENSRSGNEMVAALAASGYGRDIGPGVYDVHSPLVPTVEFMKDKIRSFLATGVLPGHPDRLWVNPDCGLKTRAWPETLAALRNMVQAAAECRRELLPEGQVGGQPQEAALLLAPGQGGSAPPARRCC